MAIRLETLFPADLEAHLAVSPVLVLPFGTIEWHSHHLPLGLDGIVATEMGARMAESLNAVLAPTGYWAVGGVPFPFTLNLPLDQVEAVLSTALEQHVSMGFKTIVIFTGHFGLDQTLAIKRVALEVMRRSNAIVLPLTTYDLVTDFYSGDHAGIGETSLMMAIRPDLVRLEAWPAAEPLPGVIGDDPRGAASPEFGHRVLSQSSSRVASLVASLRSESLKREEWIATLQLMVRILETTRSLRQTMPREAVPAIATPDYLAACFAVASADFAEAQRLLHQKLASLSA